MNYLKKPSLVIKQVVAAFAALVLSMQLLTVPFARAIGEESNQQGLQVSSLVINLNAEKGKSYNLNVTVTNVTNSSVRVSSDVNDFTSKDETGAPKILVDGQSSDPSYSFKSWVPRIADFYLKAKESKTVNFNVDVPSNAEAGGHYGVVRFSGSSQKPDGTAVALKISTGVLILARVQGKLTESLMLKQLFVTKQKDVNKGQLTIVARLQNNGNVHVRPQGTLTVRNFFGSSVATYNFGSNYQNVLPGSIRRFEQTLDKKHLFGRYKVELDAGYGTNGQTIVAESTFWIIPFKTMFISLAIIIIGFFGLRLFVKKYNQRVIRKAHLKHKR